MRLVVTADLHYEFEQHRQEVHAVAEAMCRERADVLALAGDTFALDLEGLSRCLELFAGFRGRKLLIAGNHDLWTQGGDSLELYESVIPRVARGWGFHYLDAAPLVVDEVGIVGTIGWYDYSFRDESIGVPLRFYEAKAAPGYARVHPQYAHLLDPREELPPQALAARSFWNDGKMIHWSLDDRRFCSLTLERLEAQIEQVHPAARAIVAITHHIPFADMLVRTDRDPSWAFGNAFMGCAGLGRALLRHRKITHAVFGHSHVRHRQQVGHIDAINVGSTYRRKRYEVIAV